MLNLWRKAEPQLQNPFFGIRGSLQFLLLLIDICKNGSLFLRKDDRQASKKDSWII